MANARPVYLYSDEIAFWVLRSLLRERFAVAKADLDGDWPIIGKYPG